MLSNHSVVFGNNDGLIKHPWTFILGETLNTNCEVREKTNKMQQLDVYFQQFLNMFRASLCPSSGEQDVCYCMWCAALVLLDVVGSGCGALPCGVRTV